MPSAFNNPMNAVKVPYLPINSFGENHVLSELSEESPGKNEEPLMDSNLLFPEGKDLSFDVTLIIHGMGMEKYVELFEKEKVSLETLLELNEADLEELGITSAKDRAVIVKNLEIHRANSAEFVVAENHLEDVRMAKNVFNQLLLMQNYCAYVELQMKKHKYTDYRIGVKETACVYLRAFLESAITQSKILSRSLFFEGSSDHLMGKVLEGSDLALPKHLQEKVKTRKKSKKRIILKVMVAIGFFSFILLSGKTFLKKQ